MTLPSFAVGAARVFLNKFGGPLPVGAGLLGKKLEGFKYPSAEVLLHGPHVHHRAGEKGRAVESDC
jgi:hypothetical protein